MNTPIHLKHQPILVVNNYNQFDGKYAPITDAKALSLGNAQYDAKEISVKVFRHTGNKWSRQSEELPLHRALDLTIIILASIQNKKLSRGSVTFLNEELIDTNKFQELLAYVKANKRYLIPRIKEIRRLLSNSLVI